MSSSSDRRPSLGEGRRDSDISLVSITRPQLPTYENSTDPNFAKANSKPAPLLRRRFSILFLVFIYAAIAVSGWVIQCFTIYRPIPGENAADPAVTYPRLVRAARVLMAIAALLTVPITSTVCRYAAVNFIQYNSRRKNGLTLRQSLALANNSWTDTGFYVRSLMSLNSGRQGSPFLWIAMAMTAIGFVIYPLQQILVGQEEAVAPSDARWVDITDIPNLYDEGALGWPDSGQSSALLRSILVTTTSEDFQPRLWQQRANCEDLESRDPGYEWCGIIREPSTVLQLQDWRYFVDPFVAQVPYGFNTGTIRQFAPRINSSVTYEPVPAEEFTENCSNAQDFNVAYHYSEEPWSWDLEACMPGDLLTSPFTSTRDAQHIEEVLYLNVSARVSSYPQEPSTFKAVMGTTVGFFELPNYMNGQINGPLLEKDPITPLEDSRYSQDGYGGIDFTDHITKSHERPYGLASVPGKGPLAEIALALFGNSSYVAMLQNLDYTISFPERTGVDASYCALTPPMVALDGSFFDTCETQPHTDLVMGYWLQNLAQPEITSQRLTSAAFLANEIHLKEGSSPGTASLTVYTDQGRTFQRPTTPLAGMIIVTALLGIYLLSLVILASYAAIQPSWTDTLDAFAMMRMGAALSDRADVFAVKSVATEGGVLDELPGYVGDANPEDETGRLRVGADGPLVHKRKYYASNI